MYDDIGQMVRKRGYSRTMGIPNESKYPKRPIITSSPSIKMKDFPLESYKKICPLLQEILIFQNTNIVIKIDKFKKKRREINNERYEENQK